MNRVNDEAISLKLLVVYWLFFWGQKRQKVRLFDLYFGYEKKNLKQEIVEMNLEVIKQISVLN